MRGPYDRLVVYRKQGFLRLPQKPRYLAGKERIVGIGLPFADKQPGQFLQRQGNPAGMKQQGGKNKPYYIPAADIVFVLDPAYPPPIVLLEKESNSMSFTVEYR